VTGRPNFLGSHVSRAARIEPVTPPGQVYASPAFAALARAHGTTGLACEYVGRASLPKAYGSLALYLVRRRDDPEPNAADGQ
jgi:class 3 adenylate cyclase